MEPPIPDMASCRVRWEPRETALALVVASKRVTASCPSCGLRSRAVHSTYVRRPADLPRLGQRVALEVQVRRFFCRNVSCPRRTFAEPWSFLEAHAQRTTRLATAQRAVATAASAEVSARLLTKLAMPTSPDTLLRLVRQAPLPIPTAPRVVGIDDWAMHKGTRYGSIVVDLEAHRVLDLLPDRTASTVAAWLAQHPGVTTVARDRSTEYARAVTEGAPEAQQVIDRWHLLQNVQQVSERWLTRLHPRLRALPAPAARSEPSPTRDRPFGRTRAEAVTKAESRALRLAAYDEVRRRHAAGASLLAISRDLGLARGTVRKYASAPSFPERAARAPGPSQLDPYVPHLVERLQAGCENARALWREIRAMGYAGTPQQVVRWLQPHRREPAASTPLLWRSAGSSPQDVRPDALPSPRRLAWACVRPVALRDATERAMVARIAQDPEAERGIALVERLVALVRQRCVTHGAQPVASFDAVDEWIDDARHSGILSLRPSRRALRRTRARFTQR